MKYIITEKQLKKIIENKSNHTMTCKQCNWKWEKSDENDSMKCPECGHDNNPKSKFGQPEWIKCKNCKKRFTQTVLKNGKKSLPICTHCGTHNNEHK